MKAREIKFRVWTGMGMVATWGPINANAAGDYRALKEVTAL